MVCVVVGVKVVGVKVVGVEVGVVWCVLCVLRWLCVCDVCSGVFGCVVFWCVYTWCCVVVWCRVWLCGVVCLGACKHVVLCVVLVCVVVCACGVVVRVCGEAWHAENPPCVDSKRLRAYRQHVSVCIGNGPAC